jgi:hypothetical protein
MSVPVRRLLIAVVLLVLGVLLAFELAVRTLRTQIESALGPRGEVASIEAGLRAVVLHDVRIRALREGADRWPAEDELRARRIEIVPQLSELLSAQVRIARITVEGGYLSMLRTRKGELLVLPALLAGRETASSAAMPDIHIARVELRDSALDFFDSTVRRTPHRLAFDNVRADIGPIDLPGLDKAVSIDIAAAMQGPKQTGRLTVIGEVVPATRATKIDIALHGADLVIFQPYLIQAAETGVKRGTLDLDLRAEVSDQRLKAPGKLTLTHLELASGNAFMGLPRAAVVGLLKDGNERISVDFTLEGRLDDPAFSLNEGFSRRVAASVADSLGVSLGGLVRGVGSAGGSVVSGVGEAVGKLFGD